MGLWTDPLVWVADLGVGLAFLALALATWARSRTLAVLCAGVAVTWWLGSVWPVAVFWHRGPLVHLLLAFPAVWPRVTWVRIAVVAGYAVSAVPLVWRQPVAAVMLACGILVARFLRSRATTDWTSVYSSPPVVATALVALAIVSDVLARTVVPLGAAVRPSFLVFCLALVGVAAILGAGLRRTDTERMADLVVQLGEQPGVDLRGQLARALGDPGVRLGVAHEGRFVDGAGEAVDPPAPGDPRRAIVVERDGAPAVLVVHGASPRDEPALREAVERWVAMSQANADLRDRTRVSIDEVAASRRRLLLAADEERERVARRIEQSVTEPLRTVGERLIEASAADDLVTTRLGAVLDELDRAAEGLDPVGLRDGLRAALGELATVVSVPVTLDVTAGRMDPAVERAAYYVCAEAMTNVAKHSAASRVEVRVVEEYETVVVTVSDDGRGGASPSKGSGLSGLADRVAALGGTLAVDSPRGAGTTVRASLPA